MRKTSTQKTANKIRRSSKAPSAKQLAARKKFALAAKARAKAAKAKHHARKPGSRVANKTVIVKPKRVLVMNGKKTRRKYRNGYLDLVIRGTAEKTAQGWKVGKKLIPQGKGIAPLSSGYYLDKATGAVFAKRERNVAQGFFDGNGVFHPIRSSADYDGGTAGETGGKPRHTRSKKKLAATKKASATARHRAATKARKATTSRLASRSLFRSVPLKRERNVAEGFFDGNGVFHPIRSSADYDGGTAGETGGKPRHTRSKKKLAATKKASATARHRAATKARKATTSRLASRSLFRSVPLKRARRNPSVKELRENFTGMNSRKTATMNAPNGTPQNLAKLGKLILIKAEGATIKSGSGTTWLCADAKGRLHLATTAARLYDGPAQNFGEVSQIEYEARKPHLGYKTSTIFFHKMGEEGGKKPTLIGDGNGGLKLRGGSYRIEREGIVN